jgi:hypothetical protein
MAGARLRPGTNFDSFDIVLDLYLKQTAGVAEQAHEQLVQHSTKT